MRAGRAAALTGLVEGDVAVLADTAEEELDPAVLLDLGLVRVALRDEVLRVSVQDVHLRGRDVDVREELAEHEGVVRLGVVLGQADVLVHVERDDIREPARRREPAGGAAARTHEISPFLTSEMRCL